MKRLIAYIDALGRLRSEAYELKKVIEEKKLYEDIKWVRMWNFLDKVVNTIPEED